MVKISVQQLSVSLRGTPALNAVSADFAAGECIGIIGPNGAGKSTMLRAMLGLIPSHGSVRLDGQPLAEVPTTERAKRIAYLPQGQMLHWPLTVERLVGLGRLPHLGPLSRIGAHDAAAIERAMDRAIVTTFRERDASLLSGGERARVLLARALAVEAPALFVDEPLANLDPGHQIDVMELLHQEARSGALVVAVLHDLTLAARYCGRLLLLNEGRLIADGPPQQVLTAENLRDVYGVTAKVDFSAEFPSIHVMRRTS